MSYRRQSNRQVKPIERFGDVSPHKEDEIYEEDQPLRKKKGPKKSNSVKKKNQRGLSENEQLVNEQQIGITINNVACQFEVKQRLDILRVAEKLDFTELKSESTVTVKMRERLESGKVGNISGVSCKVHKTGRVYVTGAISEDSARKVSRQLARQIQVRADYPDIRFANYRVTVVHATVRFPFGVRLPEFSHEYRSTGADPYEPELSLWVTYRMTDPKATFNIPHTGNVIVMTRNASDLKEAVKKLYPLVENHKKSKGKPRGKVTKKRLSIDSNGFDLDKSHD